MSITITVTKNKWQKETGSGFEAFNQVQGQGGAGDSSAGIHGVF